MTSSPFIPHGYPGRVSHEPAVVNRQFGGFAAIAYSMCMSNEHLDAAIKALHTGDRREARRLLGIMLRAEPENVPAWWYLAEALDDPEQKSRCLRQVLRLHPDHGEARRMLSEIERRVVKVTPPDGLARPVFEAEDQDGRLIIPGVDDDDFSQSGLHGGQPGILMFAFTVAAVVVLAVLLGITVMFRSGVLRNWPGVREPEPPPTLRALVFEVQDCTSTGGSKTTLRFFNDTEVTLEVLQGQPGQEVELLTLEPGAQGSVEVEPGLQQRYAARADAPGYTGGAAVIEVPQGSTCRVPIK